MNYKIIQTGKSGNCVLINDILVDCGVPFERIAPYINGVNYVLLTHIHSDHVNKETLESIKQLYPHIAVIGNREVHERFGVTHVITPGGFGLKMPHYVFEGIELSHSVMTTGFTWRDRGKDILFCVDTANLDNVPRRTYDYMFLESNYDAELIHDIEAWIELRKRMRLTEYRRHLSRQEAQNFFQQHRNTDHSVLIELHQSDTFYDRATTPFNMSLIEAELAAARQTVG